MTNQIVDGEQQNGMMDPQEVISKEEMQHLSDIRKVLLKGEPNVLGAVQLVIVFLHIALGTILIRRDSNVTYTSFYGISLYGIPFFLVSGSLSVAAEKNPNPSNSLIKAFMSMNIISAIESLGTLCVFCYDIYQCAYNGVTTYNDILVFLCLTNLLQFSISVSLATFGQRALAVRSASVLQIVPGMFRLQTPDIDTSVNLNAPQLHINPYVQTQENNLLPNTYYRLHRSSSIQKWTEDRAQTLPSPPPQNYGFSTTGTGLMVNPILNREQQYGLIVNQRNQIQDVGPKEEIRILSDFQKVLLKGEPKVLGAIQLVIVFIHIALGTTLIRRDLNVTYTSFYGISLYGIPFFLISGSLSVAVEKIPNSSSSLVKTFMSVNIISAIESLGALGVFCYDIYQCEYNGVTNYTDILAFLCITNLLQFSISVSLASFGYRALAVRSASAQEVLQGRFMQQQDTYYRLPRVSTFKLGEDRDQAAPSSQIQDHESVTV